MSFSIRIMRFLYIVFGAAAGFLGIALALILNSLLLASSKSFGVPFLTPFAPITNGKYADKLTRNPMWKQEARPDYLNVKNIKSQPRISRGWAAKDSDSEDEE